jgi:hypothetical protein
MSDLSNLNGVLGFWGAMRNCFLWILVQLRIARSEERMRTGNIVS